MVLRVAPAKSRNATCSVITYDGRVARLPMRTEPWRAIWAGFLHRHHRPDHAFARATWVGGAGNASVLFATDSAAVPVLFPDDVAVRWELAVTVVGSVDPLLDVVLRLEPGVPVTLV